MVEQKESRPLAGIATALLALLLFVAPLGYVLSIGPVVWLVERGCIDGEHELLTATYFPLEWLYEHASPFATLMDWYMLLWRPDSP